MQSTIATRPPAAPALLYLGGALAAGLAGLLWGPMLAELWRAWQADDSLSHGPLIPLTCGILLWMRRSELRSWNAASPAGLALLLLASLVYVASCWADIEYLKPLSLIGMLGAGIWFMGGMHAIRTSIGALGFLVFMIPWPTTLVAAVAFPLQLMSSAYAALFAGMLGIPVQRDGVHLAIVPNPEAPPIYSMLVAQQCSGLTSLMVLLALAYMVAYFTPVGLGWRALLCAAVVPLALFMNAVRLTLILIAGAQHSPDLAQWVHDHEAPVLIFFCSMGLMGIRQAILAWTQSTSERGKTDVGSPPIVAA